MNTEQPTQSGLTDLVDQLTKLGTLLRRGTQRKAVRRLLKGLDLMRKNISSDEIEPSQVSGILSIIITLQEHVMDIDHRIATMEDQVITLQEQVELSASSQHRI